MTNRSVASGAWQDAFGALNRMRGSAALAVLGLVLLTTLPLIWHRGSLIHLSPKTDSLATLALGELMLLMYVLGEAILMAPIAIAIHRFILLDEPPPAYRLDFRDARLRRFVVYACLLDMLWTLPAGLIAMVETVSISLSILLGLVAGIATLILSIRLTVLFPAVAIDAPDAGWRGAMALSQERGWTIFLVLLLTELVGMLLVAAVSPLKSWGFELAFNTHLVTGAFVVGAVQAATTLVTGAALVAAASRLYRNLQARPT